MPDRFWKPEDYLFAEPFRVDPNKNDDKVFRYNTDRMWIDKDIRKNPEDYLFKERFYPNREEPFYTDKEIDELLELLQKSTNKKKRSGGKVKKKKSGGKVYASNNKRYAYGGKVSGRKATYKY